MSIDYYFITGLQSLNSLSTVYENAEIFLKVSTAISCLKFSLAHLRDLFLFIVLLQNILTTL